MAEHAKEIFEVLVKIQIASVPTFAVAEDKRVCKPQMDSVTHNRLHRKDAKGRPVHDVSTLQKHFLSVIDAACDKLYKYLNSHTSTAKQACVLDQTRLSGLSTNIEDYPLIFPSTACPQIIDSGECIWSISVSMCLNLTC